MEDKINLQQLPILPNKPLPIIIIGAGGIVKDAHLPAYAIAGFLVQGIFDIDLEKAQNLKKNFGIIGEVFETLEKAIGTGQKYNAIFDLAVPAAHIANILEQLPDGAAVLIQKPMGENLQQAQEIIDICRRKHLVSAVNFQLRYAPYMLAAKEMIEKGLIGEVYDMEVLVNVFTPWYLWNFLYDLPRVEILYHSIHYVDLVRTFLGNPKKVYASTVRHPKMPELASTRTSMILDYDEYTQARIMTNHGHEFGREKQQSYVKFEGTKGAIKIKIGVSIDYPKGVPPTFEYIILGQESTKWKELPLKGGWFPHAFIGTMASLQNHYINQSQALLNSTEDAFVTMQLVELMYTSSNVGGMNFNLIE